MILETLLSAAIETGVGLLAEVGLDDAVRDLKERLSNSDERRRRAAFERAFAKAREAAGEEAIAPLLEHRPFEEEVIRGLLDPVTGFDVQAAAEVWEDRLRAYAPALRRFFTTLETALLADEIWGPILERYQQQRFQRGVQQALQARHLDLAPWELVHRVSAHISGSGAIAMSGGTAAGAGGVAVAGNVGQIVLQQIIMQSGVRADSPNLRQRYLSRLRNQCCALPLAALGGDVEPRKTITLDQVYVELNTVMNVPESVLEKIRRGELGEWSRVRDKLSEWQHEQFREGDMKTHRPKERSEDMRPLTALDALRLIPQLALLGDPGAGKSTFARMVIARLAEGNPPGSLSADLLPVLVILRDLTPRLVKINLTSLPSSRHDEVLAGVVRDQILADLSGLDSSGFAEGLLDVLNANCCLLVFDGLDEVPQELRGLVRQAVVAAVNRYNPPRVIVTCRQRSYVEDAILSGFDAFTLAPFDASQIENFAHAWYHAQQDLGRVDAVQAEHKAADLKRAALTPDLRELASNPMLLTTMALIHQQEVALPKERVRLYSKAVDLLLHRWQREKVEQDALSAVLRDDRRLRQMMERLAYEAHLSKQGGQPRESADVPRHQAQDILEGYLNDVRQVREFLDYVDQRAGLLMGRGGAPNHPAEYTFPHRTFQEYLAGCYLLTGSDSDRVREFYARAAEGDRWRLVAQLSIEELLFNTRNGERQLLHLAYNLLTDRVDNEQNQRATLWSGQMAALTGLKCIEGDTGSPNGGRTYLDRLRTRLVTLLSGGLDAVERCQAGNVLGHLGDPRFGAAARYLPAEDPLGFVEIPAGTFLMGSDRTRDPAAQYQEMPQHEVFLPRYYIARYPVTVAQFLAFVEASGHRRLDEDSVHGLPNHPVVNVNWSLAIQYCAWLTGWLREWPGTPEPLASLLRQEGWLVSLPSEAEWEKAARGTDGRLYPWGDEPDLNRANYSKTGIKRPSAVGCFPGGASPYGLLDISGNVWEWTRSLWGPYPYPTNEEKRAQRENLMAFGDEPRVLRGGAFWDDYWNVRCVSRDSNSPNLQNINIGFRVVVCPCS
jgi:formylglycine-generating enzyme required for sulfatase activity